MVRLDGSWSYSGSAYWVTNDNHIAICGKHRSSSIDEDVFEAYCKNYSSLCLEDSLACTRDAVVSVIKSHTEYFCGSSNYGFLVSRNRPAYNGYTGAVERVDGNRGQYCTLICGGY